MGIVLYWEMMSLYLKIHRKSPYSLKKRADLWEGKGAVEGDNNPTPCQSAGLEIQKQSSHSQYLYCRHFAEQFKGCQSDKG